MRVGLSVDRFVSVDINETIRRRCKDLRSFDFLATKLGS